MEQELIKLISGTGALGALIFLSIKYGIKALEKLYTDMRDQHKEQLQEATKREDKLMQHLDKVAETLDNINERLCEVEQCVKVRKKV
jgi:predicted nuclease with TOPRIM domain